MSILDDIRNILLPDHGPTFKVPKDGIYRITVSPWPDVLPAIQCLGEVIWTAISHEISPSGFYTVMLTLMKGETIKLIDGNWMTVRSSVV